MPNFLLHLSCLLTPIKGVNAVAVGLYVIILDAVYASLTIYSPLCTIDSSNKLKSLICNPNQLFFKWMHWYAYATITFITEVLCLVDYVQFWTTLKSENNSLYTSNLVLSSIVLWCTPIVKPCLSTIPITAAIWKF